MNRLKIVIPIFFSAVFAVSGCSTDTEKKVAYLEKGMAYYEIGEYNNAELALRQAIEIDPDYAPAYPALADTCLKLGKGPAAFEAYSRASLLDPDNLKVRIKLASFDLLGGKTRDAEQQVRAVLDRAPDNIEALFLFTSVLEHKKEADRAESVFRKILTIDENQPHAFLGLAAIAAGSGRFKAAEEHLKQAKALDPKGLKPRLLLYNFYLGMGKFDRAETELLGASADFPETPKIQLLLGNFYFSRQRPLDAEKALIRATRMGSSGIKPFLAAGMFYDATGRPEEAGNMYREAERLRPDNLRVLDTLARFHLKNGDMNQAETHITRLLEKRPDYPPVRLLKGELLLGRGSFDEAITIFDTLIRSAPGLPMAHYFKGVALLGKGDMAAAGKALGRAAALDPRNVDARLLLTDLYLRDNNFAMAEKESRGILEILRHNLQTVLIVGSAAPGESHPAEVLPMRSIGRPSSDNPSGYLKTELINRLRKKYDPTMGGFEKALSENPRLVNVFTNIILLHAAKKEYDQALEKCDRQIELLGDAPGLRALVHNLKGGLNFARKRYELAGEAFTMALAEDPRFLRPYYALARLALAAKDPARAIREFRSLLEAGPGQAASDMLMGTLQGMKGDHELAEVHYRRALSMDPTFSPAANNLAFLLAEQTDRLDEALTLALSAGERQPDNPFIADTLGWIYYKKGMYDRAAEKLLFSARKMPRNAVIRYHLGMTYFRKGEKALARRELEEALAGGGRFSSAATARKIISEL